MFKHPEIPRNFQKNFVSCPLTWVLFFTAASTLPPRAFQTDRTHPPSLPTGPDRSVLLSKTYYLSLWWLLSQESCPLGNLPNTLLGAGEGFGQLHINNFWQSKLWHIQHLEIWELISIISWAMIWYGISCGLLLI